MTKKKIDWSLHGPEMIDLYRSGFSVRELISVIEERHGVTYNSGTLTNYLGRLGVLRSRSEAHRLALGKAIRICELCSKEHHPRNYNQRWCDDCTGVGKHAKRVRLHGLPATLFEKMFEEQQHRCKICRKEFDSCINTRKKKTLFVDHDHLTGQVRGLLCPRCNNGLCYVDDKDWMDSALTYLRQCAEEENPVRVKPPRMRKYVRNSAVKS